MKALNVLYTYESLASLTDERLDLNTAMIIAKNMKTLAAPKQVIDEKRFKIIKAYAEKDKNGNLKKNTDGTIMFSEANAKECDKKLTALLSEDIDIELTKIKKSALADIKISLTLVLGLMDILEE